MSSHWLSLLAVCSFAVLSFSAQAQNATDTTTTTVMTVEKPVIITPVPKAVCSSVAAHWEGDVWVDTHNVCKYTDRTEGTTWVDAYWSCTKANADTCVTWTLVPGHWVSTVLQ